MKSNLDYVVEAFTSMSLTELIPLTVVTIYLALLIVYSILKKIWTVVPIVEISENPRPNPRTNESRRGMAI
jgi:hypothetical protein